MLIFFKNIFWFFLQAYTPLVLKLFWGKKFWKMVSTGKLLTDFYIYQNTVSCNLEQKINSWKWYTKKNHLLF